MDGHREETMKPNDSDPNFMFSNASALHGSDSVQGIQVTRRHGQTPTVAKLRGYDTTANTRCRGPWSRDGVRRPRRRGENDRGQTSFVVSIKVAMHESTTVEKEANAAR